MTAPYAGHYGYDLIRHLEQREAHEGCGESLELKLLRGLPDGVLRSRHLREALRCLEPGQINDQTGARITNHVASLEECDIAYGDAPAKKLDDASAIDDLTDAERVVSDHLTEAVNAFGKLDRRHPAELREFVDGIHACQNQLAWRIVQRHYPDGWPVKR